MSHIRRLLSYMIAAGSLGRNGQEADLLRNDFRFGLALVMALMTAVPAAGFAAPRDSAGPRAAPRAAPALPPTGEQSEPIDLNEGKSPAEMFNAGCAVCHQRPNGLAKGRSGSQLTGFLRQHYTSGIEHANAMAGYLTSGGLERGTPTPVRASPTEEPTRRPPAARPGDIAAPEGASAQNRNRRPPAAEQGPDGVIFLPPGATDIPDDARRPGRPADPAPAAAPPPAPAARPRPGSRPTETARPAEPAREAETAPPSTSASSPPVEEKPAPPPRDNIPL